MLLKTRGKRELITSKFWALGFTKYRSPFPSFIFLQFLSNQTDHNVRIKETSKKGMRKVNWNEGKQEEKKQTYLRLWKREGKETDLKHSDPIDWSAKHRRVGLGVKVVKEEAAIDVWWIGFEVSNEAANYSYLII